MRSRPSAYAWPAALLALGCGASTTDPELDAGAVATPTDARAMDRGEAEAYAPRVWRAVMAVVRATPEAVFQRIGFLSGR